MGDGRSKQIPRDCPECGGRNLYTSLTPSGSPFGPKLLPNMTRFSGYEDLQLVLCKDCGLMRFFASEEACFKLGDIAGWSKIE